MLTFLRTECCFICSYITPIIYLLAGSQRPLIKKKNQVTKRKKKNQSCNDSVTGSHYTENTADSQGGDLLSKDDAICES